MLPTLLVVSGRVVETLVGDEPGPKNGLPGGELRALSGSGVLKFHGNATPRLGTGGCSGLVSLRPTPTHPGLAGSPHP